MKNKKIDYKKLEKALYFPKNVEVVDVASMKFILVDGQGAPSGEAFQSALGALYPVAYMISMSYRATDFEIAGFEPFVVPPLEGLWTSKNKPLEGFLDKEDFVWRVMIRMPDFVTEEVVEKAKSLVLEKKKLDASSVNFGEVKDGLCVQAMHIGSFDDEPATFEQMFKFAQENDLTPVHREFHHREIYLSDFRKTAPEKLKTVLRIFVEK